MGFATVCRMFRFVFVCDRFIRITFVTIGLHSFRSVRVRYVRSGRIGFGLGSLQERNEFGWVGLSLYCFMSEPFYSDWVLFAFGT